MTGLGSAHRDDGEHDDRACSERVMGGKGVPGGVRLYLSGPMTGYPEFNYPAFHYEKARLSEAGYEVISPADLPLREDWEWVDYILVDIGSVFAVDGVATMAGCEASKGARIEACIARHRSIPVRTVDDWLAEVPAPPATERALGRPRPDYSPHADWPERFMADGRWAI